MSIILYRTHKFDAEARSYCEKLDGESGLRVVCLVDESTGEVDVAPFPKVSITRHALRQRKLLATADAAWRCGDYGLYLAAQAFPETEHFWLVEYDVRIKIQGPASDFFASFAGSPADLIAPFLTERATDWWWQPAMQVKEEPVWGCLFPILRVSASLLTAGVETRVRQARSPLYRLFWPNDESFLATTAVKHNFSVQDLNGSQTWYTDATFSFERPWSGVELGMAEPDGLIYHPVLYGADLQRKLSKLSKPTLLSDRWRRKVRRSLRSLA